ncbi:oligosaccharide flippase family protein [Nonlabens sp. Ci31]|uniref:lipopolysaccharide biosynthesis protein n=1 Tax=Nonlabens sp. Ci31 TaxID=2608253 RepID=UPI0014648EB4|nr:polysaccharide biosynthesis C-terminal domain-containing protein [Nonlabens sp. Ci31]QJP33712.1 oligosaccharide flippase family protein [Nonlabens sp. Ci31]
MSSIKNLFKNTFIYGLATVLPRLLTVLLTKLLTEYLPGKVEFGEVSIIFSYIIFANVILTYGMETAFFRFYNDASTKAKTLGTALVSLLATTLVFGLAAYLFIDQIEAATGLSAQYWKWVIAVIVFDTLMVIPFAYMRAQGKSTKYALIKLFNVLITVGMTLLFFTVLQDFPSMERVLPADRIELFFIAFLSASFITFLIVIKPYFTKWEFDATLWKTMFSYGWPILLAGFAFAINETVDKILLQKLLPVGEEEAEGIVGVYTAGYRLAVGMTLYAQAFRLGVEPFFFSQSGDKNATQQYALITKAFVAFGSVALMAYVVLVDFIKPYIVKEGFETAMEVVPLILIAYFFSGIYQTLSVWYKIQDKTRYGAYISITAAVLTIFVNVLLIPHIGYMASAYATCAAYALMMVVSYLIGRKHLAVPYDLTNILLYLILSISFSLVFFYFVREELGIESWQTYLVGALMTLAMIAVVSLREREIINKILKRK